MTSATYTHTSYKAAMSALKRGKAAAGTVTWDSGEGFTGSAYYCAWRKRVVSQCITPTGAAIING